MKTSKPCNALKEHHEISQETAKVTESNSFWFDALTSQSDSRWKSNLGFKGCNFFWGGARSPNFGVWGTLALHLVTSVKKCAPYNPGRSGCQTFISLRCVLWAFESYSVQGSMVSKLHHPANMGRNAKMHACMRLVSSKCRYTSMSHQDKWCKLCFLIGLAFPASLGASFFCFLLIPALSHGPPGFSFWCCCWSVMMQLIEVKLEGFFFLP